MDNPILGVRPLVTTCVIGVAAIGLVVAMSLRQPSADLTATDLSAEEVSPTPAPAADEGGNAVLQAAGVDIVPVVQVAGRSWSGAAILDSPHYDGTLKITRRTVSYPGGSIEVDRNDWGSLVRVAARSGMADRCGSTDDPLAAANSILGVLGKGALRGEEVTRLKAALSSKGDMGEVTRIGMIVRGIGGCIKTVVIKAA